MNMTNVIDDIFNLGQEPKWKTELLAHLSNDEQEFIRTSLINIDTIGINSLEHLIKLLANSCVRDNLIDDKHAIIYTLTLFNELKMYQHSILDSQYDYKEVDAIKEYTSIINNIDEVIIKRKALVNIREFKIKQRYKQKIREPGQEG